MPFSWAKDEDLFTDAVSQMESQLQKKEQQFTESDWSKVLAKYKQLGGRIRKEAPIDKEEGNVESVVESLRQQGRIAAADAVRASRLTPPPYSRFNIDPMSGGGALNMQTVTEVAPGVPSLPGTEEAAVASMKETMKQMAADVAQFKKGVKAPLAETREKPLSDDNESRLDEFERKARVALSSSPRRRRVEAGQDRASVGTLIEAVMSGADPSEVARHALGVGGKSGLQRTSREGRRRRGR